MDHFHLGSLLDSDHLLKAKKDIRRCQLNDRERDILLKTLDGVSVMELKNVYQVNRQNIYHIRKTALVRIYRELGPRDWIEKESKGKIEEWNITIPRFPSAK